MEQTAGFIAKFNGQCAYGDACKMGGRIIKGTHRIKWDRTTRGRAWHVECGDSKPATPAPDGNIAPEAYDALHKPTFPETDSLTAAIIAAVAPHVKAAVSAEDVASLVEAQIAPLRKKVDGMMQATRVEIIQPETGEAKDLGVQHRQFPLLLAAVQARLNDGHRINVWMKGPSGSGKTTAAFEVANALGLEYSFTGAIDTPYPLIGFIDAHGRCVRTPFRERYENGGIFLFDEYDASNANATLPFNAALANGHCAFPDTIVKRHADFVAIAAANTFGQGATSEYVGRNRLDGAALDRFITIDWELDEALEMATCPNAAWVTRVQGIRRNVARQGIKVIISPRASYFGAALLAAGLKQADVEQITLRKGMTEDQWESVQ